VADPANARVQVHPQRFVAQVGDLAAEAAWYGRALSDYEPRHRDRRTKLDELTIGDDRPSPKHLKAQVSRELDRLELVLEHLKAVEAQRDDLLIPASPEAAGQSSLAVLLMALKGVGPEFAGILWSEGLFRSFANRRQVAAYAGLAPTPWRSGSIDREQGV
jgi:transposase